MTGAPEPTRDVTVELTHDHPPRARSGAASAPRTGSDERLEREAHPRGDLRVAEAFAAIDQLEHRARRGRAAREDTLGAGQALAAHQARLSVGLRIDKIGRPARGVERERRALRGVPARGLQGEERRLGDGQPREDQVRQAPRALLLDEAEPRLLREVLGAVDADAACQERDHDAVIVLLDERVPGGRLSGEGVRDVSRPLIRAAVAAATPATPLPPPLPRGRRVHRETGHRDLRARVPGAAAVRPGPARGGLPARALRVRRGKRKFASGSRGERRAAREHIAFLFVPRKERAVTDHMRAPLPSSRAAQLRETLLKRFYRFSRD